MPDIIRALAHFWRIIADALENADAREIAESYVDAYLSIDEEGM